MPTEKGEVRYCSPKPILITAAKMVRLLVAEGTPRYSSSRLVHGNMLLAVLLPLVVVLLAMFAIEPAHQHKQLSKGMATAISSAY